MPNPPVGPLQPSFWPLLLWWSRGSWPTSLYSIDEGNPDLQKDEILILIDPNFDQSLYAQFITDSSSFQMRLSLREALLCVNLGLIPFNLKTGNCDNPEGHLRPDPAWRFLLAFGSFSSLKSGYAMDRPWRSYVCPIEPGGVPCGSVWWDDSDMVDVLFVASPLDVTERFLSTLKWKIF